MTFEERPFKNAGERAKIVERAKTASAWSPWYSRKNALGVGGGAASAGRTAAPLSLADVDESGAASAPPTLPSAP